VIDNGSEFTSQVVDQWAYENQVELHFITPGVCGAERPDGTWEGWLEFHPTNITQPTCKPIRKPANPTAGRWNIGPVGLSRSILKVRSPVPKGGCSS
jgi:transposase InsO family protein